MWLKYPIKGFALYSLVAPSFDQLIPLLIQVIRWLSSVTTETFAVFNTAVNAAQRAALAGAGPPQDAAASSSGRQPVDHA